MTVKKSLATATVAVAAGAIVTLALRSSFSVTGMTPESAAESLCSAPFAGPAFIIPDESRSTVAVHAGPFRGVSFLSLKTGHPLWSAAIGQRLLAASIARTVGVLILASSDGNTVRISNFDAATRQLRSSEIFRNLDAQLAAFAPNGKYLLGVTTSGSVFKVDLTAKKIEVIDGLAQKAVSLAISPNSTRLYLAGDGLTAMDIDPLRVASHLTAQKNLLEVAASPDGHTLVVRNWNEIQLFDLGAIKNGEASVSNPVDPIPNGSSISSTRRLAISQDGSSLFYIRTADRGASELLSLSMTDLHIEQRSMIDPYPQAIAIVPDLQWVLLAAGNSDRVQIEAIDIKTQAVLFKTALNGSSLSSRTAPDGCQTARNTG